MSEEKTIGLISKQRRWQLARVSKGLCGQCGKKQAGGKQRCQDCQKKHYERNRKRLDAARKAG